MTSEAPRADAFEAVAAHSAADALYANASLAIDCGLLELCDLSALAPSQVRRYLTDWQITEVLSEDSLLMTRVMLRRRASLLASAGLGYGAVGSDFVADLSRTRGPDESPDATACPPPQLQDAAIVSTNLVSGELADDGLRDVARMFSIARVGIARQKLPESSAEPVGGKMSLVLV